MMRRGLEGQRKSEEELETMAKGLQENEKVNQKTSQFANCGTMEQEYMV